MRILIGLVVGFCASFPVMADNVLKPITDLSEFSGAKSANKIVWNNQRPEQQRALNQFYRSMNQKSSTQPTIERQQHVRELRSMNPKQRQQLFLNYIQQNR
jgi:hypothetical protein